MEPGALAVRAAGKWPDQGPTFTIVSSVMNGIAGSLVVFRVAQTFVRRRTIVLEDTMVMCALAADLLSTVLGCEAIRYGFGRHGKDIKPSGGDVQLALMYFFLFQIFYKIVLCFNKLSFLFLYHRVFQSRIFRIIVLITLGIVVSGTVTYVIVTVFQCIPIRKSWVKAAPGHCIDNAAFRWAWASYNTAMDLWVCLLPLPVISRLQMERAQRFGVMLVFLLGLFVCITSIIRMVALTESISTTDPTWGSLPAFVWSSVEASTGLICACLPSLKQPIQRCFPKLFRRTHSGSHGRSYVMDHYRGTSSSPNPKSLISSQTRPMWRDQGNHTAEVSGGQKIRRDDKFGTRESQERIIEGGITVATDISLKSDQLSLEEQKEQAALKRGHHAY